MSYLPEDGHLSPGRTRGRNTRNRDEAGDATDSPAGSDRGGARSEETPPDAPHGIAAGRHAAVPRANKPAKPQRGGSRGGSHHVRHSRHGHEARTEVIPVVRNRREARVLQHQQEQGLGRLFSMTGLGWVLPGVGLMFSRRLRSGMALFALFGLGIIAAAVFLYWKGVTRAALYVAVRPNLVLAITIALGVFILLWCLSIIATGIINRPYPRRFWKDALMVGWIGLLCTLLVIPMYQLGQSTAASRLAVGKILGTLKQAAGAARPDLNAADPWGNVPRVSVLLLGTDAETDRMGLRTDSMMVATIDTRTGDTLLVGVPRNLEGWQIRETSPMRAVFPSGTADCTGRSHTPCQLTNYWDQVARYAAAHPEAYPGDTRPGLTELRQVVGDFLGVPIDNTIIINMAGFQELVDAMGGVTITVRERLPIGGKVSNGGIVPGSIKGWIEPGQQHMDGYTAMWYSRSRATTSDFSRMRRQRCMVGALARQVNPANMLSTLPDVMRVAEDNIEMDIPTEHLAAWGDLGSRIQGGTMRSLPFTSKLFNNTKPDYEWVHAYIRHALDPAAPAPTTDGWGKPLPTATPSRATPSPTATATTPSVPGSSTTTTPDEGVVNVDDAC